MRHLLVVTLLCSIASGTTYVTNGNFEEILTVGWTEEHTATTYAIDRNTNYDPDPDYEVYIYESNSSGDAQIYQLFDIPTIDIDLSLNAKLYATATTGTAGWTAAAIIVSYIDEFDSIMGETRICQRAGSCPWMNSSTVHLITAPDSNWHTYSFKIAEELENLPGVNAAHVKRLKVALIDTAFNC